MIIHEFFCIRIAMIDDRAHERAADKMKKIEMESTTMDHIRIETDRLILRKFEESDMEAIYSLLSDEEVNTFLPWYPVKDMAEARM